jgi:hypothetical protein
MYRLVYAALLDGVTEDTGTALVNIDGPIATKIGIPAGAYKPQFPEKQVNEIAYEAATGLIRILNDKVVDAIMPPQLSKMANEKVAAKTTTKLAANEYLS